MAQPHGRRAQSLYCRFAAKLETGRYVGSRQPRGRNALRLLRPTVPQIGYCAPHPTNASDPGEHSMSIRALSAAMILFAVSTASAQTQWPNQQAGDFVTKNFRFASGETIAELKLHYVTLGT